MSLYIIVLINEYLHYIVQFLLQKQITLYYISFLLYFYLSIIFLFHNRWRCIGGINNTDFYSCKVLENNVAIQQEMV